MGAPAGFENTLLRGAWSKDDGGRRVAVGGADRMVCIWEVDSGRIQYKVGFFFVRFCTAFSSYDVRSFLATRAQ